MTSQLQPSLTEWISQGPDILRPYLAILNDIDRRVGQMKIETSVLAELCAKVADLTTRVDELEGQIDQGEEEAEEGGAPMGT